MLFRQPYDRDSSTYTYLLGDEDTREAIIIDPVFEQLDRDSTLIESSSSLRYSGAALTSGLPYWRRANIHHLRWFGPKPWRTRMAGRGRFAGPHRRHADPVVDPAPQRR